MMNKLFDKLTDFMPNEIALKVEKEKLDPVDENSSIGEQIRYYRCLAGLRQDDLALRIGFERGMIYKYENEEIKLLNVKAFKAIIQELDIEEKIIINDDYISFMLNNPIEEIIDFRNKHNLSRTKFAQMMDADVCAVTKWETGRRNITRKTYEKYKKVLATYKKI